jgi:O-antigen ligase
MIKKIIFSIFLFFFLYLDPIYFGSLKWAQIWKVLFIMFNFLFFFKKSIINKILFIYLLSTGFYFITPFFFVYMKEIFVQITGLLFFPSIYFFIYSLTKKQDNYLSILTFISVFFILSYVPFYLELLPQLGSSYNIKSLGISDEKTLSGLFQKAHPSSQVLAYSCVTLFYVTSKTKNKFIKFQLLFIVILGLFFQIKTFVRLGLFMSILGAYFFFIYRSNFARKVNVFIFLIVVLIISFPLISESKLYDSYKQRLFGENKYSYSYTDSEVVNFDKMSSGRLGIWKSSFNNLLLNDDPIEVLFGITEPELQKRNKISVGLSVFSHNGIIDSLVTNGLIGLLLFIYFIITWAKTIFKRNKLYFKNSKEFKYIISVFLIFLFSILLQGGKIIYDGLFISISILMLFSNKIQHEH